MSEVYSLVAWEPTSCIYSLLLLIWFKPIALYSNIECGNLGNAFSLWVIIFKLETIAFEGVLLHFMIIECADGINVWLSGKLLKELLGIVEIEDFLDAVVVLSYVVLVGVNAKWLVNLILHYYVYMHKDDFNLIIIY